MVIASDWVGANRRHWFQLKMKPLLQKTFTSTFSPFQAASLTHIPQPLRLRRRGARGSFLSWERARERVDRVVVKRFLEHTFSFS